MTLKTKNISGKTAREMTSTISALSLVNSFHQVGSQLGTLSVTPAIVSGDVARCSVFLPGADEPSLPI